jgi:hypothetical protein
MIDVAVKCRTLFFAQIWTQCNRKGSAATEWLEYWKIQKLVENSPVAPTVPRKLEYIYADV